MTQRIVAGVILGFVVLAAAAVVQSAGNGHQWSAPQGMGAVSH